MAGLAQGADGRLDHGLELLVRHGNDDGVINTNSGLLYGSDTVFMPGLTGG